MKERCVICNGDYYVTESTGLLKYDLCYDCYMKYKDRIRVIWRLHTLWRSEMTMFDIDIKKEAEE